MRPLSLLPLFLVLGCAAELERERLRVAVRLAPASTGVDDVVWETAMWDLRAWRFQPCATPDVTLDWALVPDRAQTAPGIARPRPYTLGLVDPQRLLQGAERAPVGPWCRLELLAEGVLRVEGVVEGDDRSVALELELPGLTHPQRQVLGEVVLAPVSPGSTLEAPAVFALVAELGGPDWLAPIAGDLASGDVAVTPDDAVHDALVANLLADAALYEDRDFDRQVDEDREGTRIAPLVPLGSVVDQRLRDVAVGDPTAAP